jgi:hypothetical protein
MTWASHKRGERCQQEQIKLSLLGSWRGPEEKRRRQLIKQRRGNGGGRGLRKLLLQPQSLEGGDRIDLWRPCMSLLHPPPFRISSFATPPRAGRKLPPQQKVVDDV